MRDPQDYSSEFLDSEPPSWVARGLAYLLTTLFLLALVAAFIVEVPEVVSARFTLAPVNGSDPVRARRDGVVTELMVHEGDTVPAGATLLMIRSASLSDRSGDQRTMETQRRGDEDRLRIAASQYETRKRADEAEQRRLTSRVASLQRLIASKQRRLDLTRGIADDALAAYRSGSVNRMEASRLDLEATTLAEEVQNSADDLDDAKADLARLERDGQSRDLEYQDIRRSLVESRETAQIRIDALGRDLVNLTDAGLAVHTPCRGTVLRLQVSSAGAVVREGDVLSEVACAGERLQAELRVGEAGVPQIKTGQAVKLRYDAFPYQRYGVRFGTVRWAGSAGVASGDTASFRALVDLADDSIPVRGILQPLLPGMSGQADVVVGRRSLVSYAVEPIRALKENFRQAPR